MTDSESILDKLKSMGVQIGTGKVQPSTRPLRSNFGIETVIDGTDLQNVYGQTYLIKEEYQPEYIHGRLPLCINHEMDTLAACGNTPRITHPGGENIVFLDTETSGLAGGTGTYVFLVGMGYRTPNGFELIQFFMRDPGQEAAFLASLDQWLARFNVVVTFNGKTFDVPLLNTRFQMNGITSPFSSFEHLDILHIARRLWRNRLPSRALGELEKEVIQFFRSGEDIPGWMIPQMYFDYLRSGDARPLAGIFYHNARDILSLAALTGHIADMLSNPLGQSVDFGLDLAAIARLYEDMGRLEEAATLYERSLEMGDLPEEFFFKIMERFALLRRKTGEWEKAALLWQKAADHGEFSACVELSKYHEHRQRNFSEALTWARKALEILDSTRYFDGRRNSIEQDIERRIGRLYQRVYRNYNGHDFED